jgi:hypothetical protein
MDARIRKVAVLTSLLTRFHDRAQALRIPSWETPEPQGGFLPCIAGRRPDSRSACGEAAYVASLHRAVRTRGVVVRLT